MQQRPLPLVVELPGAESTWHDLRLASPFNALYVIS